MDLKNGRVIGEFSTCEVRGKLRIAMYDGVKLNIAVPWAFRRRFHSSTIVVLETRGCLDNAVEQGTTIENMAINLCGCAR